MAWRTVVFERAGAGELLVPHRGHLDRSCISHTGSEHFARSISGMSPLAAAASPMTLGSSCGCNGLADMTHRDHAWPTSEIMQCRGKHIYMYCRFSGGGGMG